MIWGNLLHLGYHMWEDRDVPDVGYVHARFARDHLRCERNLWSDLTKQMATAGMNFILIDLGEGVLYDSHPELAIKGAWNRSQLRAELMRLRQIGLEPIPKMNFSTAHDEWLGEYSRMVSTPRYYEVVSDLIAEVIDLFDSPRFFHLGMDEENFEHQKYYSHAVARQHELWWHDLMFMIEHVERGGPRAWVWSDYSWHHKEEFYRNMPKSVIQSNWYYGAKFEDFGDSEAEQRYGTYVKTYRDLSDHGYDQIPCASNWSSPLNIERTVEYCQQNVRPEKLLGFLTAPWHPTQSEFRFQHEASIQQIAAAATLWNAHNNPAQMQSNNKF
jgi:hypothetical protein